MKTCKATMFCLGWGRLVLFVATTVHVAALREHRLSVELANGTSWHIIYNKTSFPDVSKEFKVNPNQVIKLTIRRSRLRSIDQQLMNQLTNLKYLTLNGNLNLRALGDDLFQNNRRLVEVNLNDNGIEIINKKAFKGAFPDEKRMGVLFLKRNRLSNFPPFITPCPGLKKIHVDGNPLIALVHTELRNLPQLKMISVRNANLLEVGAQTFKDNRLLADINLSDNPGLKRISSDAFEGPTQLKHLNLSNTGISTVPHRGLANLEVLSLRNSNGIWKIANEIVQLPKLRYVEVPSERRFLCCAFIYERRKLGHFGFGRCLNGTKNCTRVPSTTPSTTATQAQTSTSSVTTDGFWGKRRRRRNLLWFGGDGGFVPSNKTGTSPTSDTGGGDGAWTDSFLTNTVAPHTVIYHRRNETGSLSSYKLTPVTCVPGPDALRPCDDIMGNTVLSVLSWLVSLLALFSNAVVFSVLVFSKRSFTVTKFLITNLAFADMCLGLYLFIMISASTHTHGVYYNHVVSWQYGAGCKVAGFLAIFASQLSMLVLTVITIERYLAIVYAVYLSKRLHMRSARILCALSWLASALMALLPLVGVNSYNEVALCLPFKVKSLVDVGFIAFILTFNTVLCIVVFLAYFRMYWVVRSPQTDTSVQSRNDSAIAKRMALLVFTDFACWAPIAIIGLFSAAGYSDAIGMDVIKSKYLLVIFFPINSICNPFLYALSTKTFRREVYLLLVSCGMCQKLAMEYPGTTFSKPSHLNKDRGHSDTQSTFVSRKDSKMVSIKTFFKRTMMPEKAAVREGNRCCTKTRNNEMLPMSGFNHVDLSPNTETTPISGDAFTYSKEGSSSDIPSRNSTVGLPHMLASSNTVSPEPFDESFVMSSSGHLTVQPTSYKRSESATSNTSDVSMFSDEALLINQRKPDKNPPTSNTASPNDHRL